MNSCGSFPNQPCLMSKSLNKYLVGAILVLCVVVGFQWRHATRITEERDRYRSNNTALLSEVERIQIDSATMALDVKGLRLSIDEYKQFRAEDAAEIKRLGVKLKNLEAAARHEIEVNVPIDVPVQDTVVIRDTIPILLPKVELLTPYIRLSGIIENNRLSGDIHIPVTLHQAVWIEYRRRWLFWKKVKAVHQTISSDNPYVEICYSEFIKIE